MGNNKASEWISHRSSSREVLFVLGCLIGRSASIDESNTEQKAYLFRTNYNLFNCAVQLIIDRGLKSVGFVGVREDCLRQREGESLHGLFQGKEALGFEKILDVFYLWLDPEERRKSKASCARSSVNTRMTSLESYQIKDPQLQSFTSFKTFEKFSQEIADGELLGKIKLVQLHGHSLIDKIKQLQEKSCSDLSQASPSPDECQQQLIDHLNPL